MSSPLFAEAVGAELHAADVSGHTALHLACHAGHVKVVQDSHDQNEKNIKIVDPCGSLFTSFHIFSTSPVDTIFGVWNKAVDHSRS